MKTAILTVRYDEEFGGLGLHIEGMRKSGTNPATEGLQVAHDLLEHVNGLAEIGDITDELEALGGIWFVRGQFNDLRRNSRVGSMYSVHQNIAADIVRMFADFFHGAPVDLTVPRTKACAADADFEEIIREALTNTRGEVAGTGADADELESLASREAAYIAICLPRMRRGYRKAKRRFGKATAANSLFWDIADTIDRNCDRRDMIAGQQYKLTFGFDDNGNAKAFIEEWYGEEFE